MPAHSESLVTPARVVLLMGVAGAGKTTVGQALADALGWTFEDADDYHPPTSTTKMARGEALTDADRMPWLDRLGALVRDRLQDGPPTVLACSALRATYRDRLGADLPGVVVVWLDVSAEILRERLVQRKGHIFGPDLLPSQFDTLEPPADALHLDGAAPVGVLLQAIRRALPEAD